MLIVKYVNLCERLDYKNMKEDLKVKAIKSHLSDIEVLMVIILQDYAHKLDCAFEEILSEIRHLSHNAQTLVIDRESDNLYTKKSIQTVSEIIASLNESADKLFNHKIRYLPLEKILKEVQFKIYRLTKLVESESIG